MPGFNSTMKHDPSKFFNHHSLKYIEMALKTDHIERINNPDGYGKRVGDCGDTIEFFLIWDKPILKSVSFFVQGCLNTTACCNTVVNMVEGNTIDMAWEILPEQVIDFLESLPEDHNHCAELAVGAFYLALNNLISKSVD